MGEFGIGGSGLIVLIMQRELLLPPRNE